MTFWQINAFIAVAAIVMDLLLTIKIARLSKIRYPELHFRKKHWSDRARSILAAFLVCFCPIVNVIFLIYLIIFDEDMIEDTIEKTYINYKKEKEHERGV